MTRTLTEFDFIAMTKAGRAILAANTTIHTYQKTSSAGKVFTVAEHQDSRSVPQTETKAFKAWFGDSKVVDADGKPLVVYHGTARNTDAFDKGQPVFFTENKDDASFYAQTGRTKYTDESPSANVTPAFLALKNPKEFSGTTDMVERNWKKDEADGFDGYKMSNGQWVAFHPTQIKSAIGNSGKWSKTDASIVNQKQE